MDVQLAGAPGGAQRRAARVERRVGHHQQQQGLRVAVQQRVHAVLRVQLHHLRAMAFL